MAWATNSARHPAFLYRTVRIFSTSAPLEIQASKVKELYVRGEDLLCCDCCLVELRTSNAWVCECISSTLLLRSMFFLICIFILWQHFTKFPRLVWNFIFSCLSYLSSSNCRPWSSDTAEEIFWDNVLNMTCTEKKTERFILIRWQYVHSLESFGNN